MFVTVSMFSPGVRHLALIAITMLFSAPVPASPDFTEYESVDKRQKAFFSYFLPLVRELNSEILAIREKLAKWREDPEAVDSAGRRIREAAAGADN